MRTTGLLAAVALAALGSLGARAADLGYDPKADPFEQYHEAVASAAAQDKLVLIVAGGEWCYWCHVLDRFLTRNADVRAELERTFVMMKVYVGEENYNEFFFSQLPPARGAPHFWIVSPERNVLSSQSTGTFEHGKRGYDKQQFLGFIAQWREHVRERLAARTEANDERHTGEQRDTPERT